MQLSETNKMSANAFSFEIKLKRENKVYYENVCKLRFS